MDESRLNNMRCHVLPGKVGPSFVDVATYVNVYGWWKDYWVGLMQSLGSELPSLDEFFRQDYVVALLEGNVVVALIAINQFNLWSRAAEHPYFEKYQPSFHDFLEREGIRSVFSGQWITVNQEYSARQTGMNFAAIILGLGHQVYRQFASAQTALVSVARADNASANTAKRFGWRVVGERFDLHNVACEQIALVGRPSPHGDPRVNQFIDFFWNRRMEHDRGYETVRYRETRNEERLLGADR